MYYIKINENPFNTYRMTDKEGLKYVYLTESGVITTKELNNLLIGNGTFPSPNTVFDFVVRRKLGYESYDAWIAEEDDL